jgi:hypothetical protein
MSDNLYENGTDKFHQPNPHIADETTTAVVPCERCGRLFTTKRPWGRFCRNSCRVMAHKQKAGGSR